MAVYDITTLGSGLEFDTTLAVSIYSVRVPGTDWVAVSWEQSTTLVYIQLFSVNRSTGALTAVGSPLDVEGGTTTGTGNGTCIVPIDGTNLMMFWTGPSGDGFAQLISIDGSGNLSTNGSALEYDVADATSVNAILWDSGHVLVTWTGVGADGFAIVLTYNTGLGTIVAAGTAFEFDTTNCLYPSVAQLSTTKAVVFYRGTSLDGFAIVLDVAAVTYAVTAAGSAFEWLDTSTISANSVVVISTGSPMVVANIWYNFADKTSKVQTFNINTTTWAITAFGSATTLYTATAISGTSNAKTLYLLDSTHLVGTAYGTDDDAFAFVLTYDSGTGALTSLSAVEWRADDTFGLAMADMGTNCFVALGTDSATSDGFMQTLRIGDVATTAKFFPFLDRR